MSPESIRAELEKILSSACFVHAERLRTFLRFAVEQTLNNPDHALKEYVIGTVAYGRDASFDPRIDAMVRVDATRLRAKLRDYYATEGHGDAIRIDLPKGTYSPAFVAHTPPPSSPQPDKYPDVSIVVLPFVNLADRESDYFSDGLTEELIHAMAQIPRLRVIARTSAFAFKGHSEDVREIGRKLRVQYLMEGTVRQDGKTLRVTAQLIDCADGFHLWSRRYDREPSGIFALQDAIAQEVVRTLSLDLALDTTNIGRRTTEHLPAYELYLKGRHFWNRQTPEGFRKSIEYFQEALAIHPTYAPAFARLADTYNLLGIWGVWPPEKAFPQAREAASRAIELDGKLAEACTPWAGCLALYDWRWREAENGFERALALNPADENAHHAFAITCLLPQSRFDEALYHVQAAESLDPLSPLISGSHAAVLFYARRYQEALAQCQKALDMEPDSWRVLFSKGRILEQLGNSEEAIGILEKAAQNSGNAPSSLGSLGHCYASSGDRRKSADLVAQLESLSRERYVSPFEPALVCVGMGDYDRALECLEKACDERAAWIVWAAVDPRLDCMRLIPRFNSILERMNLASQAGTAGVSGPV